MSVLKVIEIIGTSPRSFEAAVNEGLMRARKTLEGITGIDIVGQNVKVENGKIKEYRVVMKVAFILK